MKTVFFDVDTQLDFLLPAGALYVSGAELIVPAIAALNQYAATHGIVVVSTMDAHAENDPEFRKWPAHCVAGTLGQHKPQSTLVTGQRLLEKTTTNCFLAPQLAPLLEELAAERYVVYGVVTEICVQYAALGLLKTGKRVELVTDAVKSLDESTAARFLRDFVAAGGKFTTVNEVCV
jgi:nicotinamidase/pyrazinamidase